MFKSGHFRVIRRDDIPLGGFAGIVETRMLMDPRLWPDARDRTDISHGLGDFIYAALGYFKPKDGAPTHPHENVDIVTLVSSGSVGHKGTVGDGTVIQSLGAQVQRAGTGMLHSEFSASSEKADFVQMWFIPPEERLQPGYRNFPIPKNGNFVTVLGGDSPESFDSRMRCQIGWVPADQEFSHPASCIVIVFGGDGTANGEAISYADLVEADSIEVLTNKGVGLILISYDDGLSPD